MKYEFIELPERSIIGKTALTSIDTVGAADTVSRLWNDFYETRAEKGFTHADTEVYKFVSVNHNYDKRAERFDAIVGCFEQQDGCSRDHPELQKYIIPAGVYAKIIVENATPDSVSYAWGEIYKDSRILSECDFNIQMKAYRQADNGVDIFISTSKQN